MAHQSLYRRYRPRRFGELRGQDHVVRVLQNAVREDRVGHAYLFSGPRGTGKTTSARILAKVLNCETPVDGEPCGTCDSCLAVEAGTSFDVHELDAASNNGVDDIRELIERASYTTAGRNKVYILDEVHMLSRAAEAALLKTLEEPPPHVVFVLATTDPQKVSATIRSRTQHIEFHLLPADELEAHVRWVAQDAGLELTDDAVEAVLHMGGGSARDTLSALDQVVAAGGVAPELVPLDELIEGLIEADAGRALAALAASVHGGRDPRALAEDLIAELRDGFLALVAPELVQLSDRRQDVVRAQAERLGLPAVVRSIEVLGEMLVELRHAPDPRVLLDVALVKLTNVEADTSASALAVRIDKLEKAVAAGGGTSSPRAAPAGDAAAGPPARARLGSAVAAAPEPAAAPTAAPVEARASDPGTRPERETAPAPTPQSGAPARPVAARPGPERPAPADGPAADRLAADQASADRPATDRPPADRPATDRPPADRPAATSGGPATDIAPAAGGTAPNRDQLTLAWADQILPRLSRQAKPVLAAGHWVARGDGVALAVPNEPHRVRSETHRPELEAALAAHFGQPVPVVFVVDAPEAPQRGGAPRERAGAPAPVPDPEEAIDPAELVDAGPEHRMAPIERVTQHFPGAELLDEA